MKGCRHSEVVCYCRQMQRGSCPSPRDYSTPSSFTPTHVPHSPGLYSESRLLHPIHSRCVTTTGYGTNMYSVVRFLSLLSSLSPFITLRFVVSITPIFLCFHYSPFRLLSLLSCLPSFNLFVSPLVVRRLFCPSSTQRSSIVPSGLDPCVVSPGLRTRHIRATLERTPSPKMEDS